MKFTSSDHEVELTVDHLYVAGWTGRNKEAVDHHIEELAAIGIAPPSQVPLYYRVSNTLLTQERTIEVLGNGTSGEIEPILFQQDGEIWIGLASDHTDRDLEAHSVAASKQICLKPVAKHLWRYDDVKDNLDDFILSCSIKENGKWVIYQQGTLASIRPLGELMSASGFTDNCAMLCGTLTAIGGVRSASEYTMELHDPISNTKINMVYGVKQLPIVA